jgi:cytochrome c553
VISADFRHVATNLEDMSTQRTWPQTITALLDGEDLSVSHATWAMNEIVSGQVTDAQLADLAAFYAGLPAGEIASKPFAGPLHQVSALACKSCHEKTFEEWSESMHAKSTALSDPIHEFMYRRAMGVTVDQRVHAARAERLRHRGGIDVHDLRRAPADVLATAGAQPLRDCAALREAEAAEHPAQERIADDAAQALVTDVVRAERVAVHQQHAATVTFRDRAVIEQRGARLAAEALADQEVAVAAHDQTGHAAVHEAPQGCDHGTGGRIGIVVAQPGLEQVAEYVEPVRAARLPLQERHELICDRGVGRVEMQVGDQQGLHAPDVTVYGAPPASAPRKQTGAIR